MSKTGINVADKNGMWVGDSIKRSSVHAWLKTNLPKPELCQSCNLVPPLDIANISPTYNPDTYTRELSNWRWLCRRCHMSEDGRFSNLKRGRDKPFYDSCMFCERPHKAKGLCNLHYKQLRAYGVLYV